jgi:hypothetical protein
LTGAQDAAATWFHTGTTYTVIPAGWDKGGWNLPRFRIFTPMRFVRLVLPVPVLLVLFVNSVSGQKKDSAMSAFSFTATYGFHMPGGDLADRYGFNSSAGAGCTYKTSRNWTYSLQWSYLFSNNVRESGILDSIATSAGPVIDVEGKYADIHLYERGFLLGINGGKIFGRGFASVNPNSGIMLTGGVGYLQHKIRIFDTGERAPQVTGEYKKGYDRLTSGLAFTEFAGYYYMSKNRYVNFFAGFEFTQAITKSRRSWDYDLMRADTKQRTDLLYGFRFGWMIPLYRSE